MMLLKSDMGGKSHLTFRCKHLRPDNSSSSNCLVCVSAFLPIHLVIGLITTVRHSYTA
jgi:hypothetical protein